ncbi:putative metal-dependent hydrolase YcfH [Candidatus Profftia lariciata]|uniref:YchF/TatD family DNA exonuclease n=1 Tax=Candidatus Profftia lariciata TaxID=1987921 RepID=UPI001D011BCF|nr:YchF/TatD family DNA exonuclease [Candidatus Profftia lariciata]UDG81438.1 putative metal-dependent hydrolase YcfH [Candidatus Profftia lariciata]
MYLVDSHCHLDKLDYIKLHMSIENVLENAKSQNVGFVLAVSTTLSGYIIMREQIGQRNNVAFSCGIHPLYLTDNYNINKLSDLAKDSEVIAIGETGLDYYYDKNNIALQQESFRQHIQIGHDLNKPIIIHMRNANKDTLDILREEQIHKCGGVLHCFTADRDIARQLLDMNCYISFSGIVTFDNANALRKVVKYIPNDHILVETDSPYLSPVPYRGKQNQPAYVREIASYIAMLKDISLDDITKYTTNNFNRLFGLNLSCDI